MQFMCGIRDKVFLCDTFDGVVKTGEQDAGYRDGLHSDTSLEIVQGLPINEFSRGKIDASINELKEERSMVGELLPK